MIAKIIKIGNSKGIRIPNHILKQFNMMDQIEITVDKDEFKIILTPVSNIREGWTEAFKVMHEKGDDSLIVDDSIDLDDWEW